MRGGGETSNPHDDALLSRLYQEVSERQEPRYAAGYDMAAGLDRYQSWLHEHSQGAVLDPIEPDTSGPDTSGPDAFLTSGTARTEWSADLAVIELYSTNYRSLVRLAAMLVRDTQTAEEVVQDAFVSMHEGWHRLKDTEKALAYMRQAVVNKSRSVLRHRMVVDKNLQKAPPDMPSAEHGAFVLLERDAVVAALRDLPERQREAIVLRYYADLSEAEIAATMKISRGAVKSHTARGMAALRASLEQELPWPPTEPSRTPPRSGTSSPTSCAWRCTRRWIRSSPRTAWSRSAPESRPIRPYTRALLGPYSGLTRALRRAPEALFVAQDVRAAGLGAQDVRAAGLGAQLIGAAGLGAEHVGAAGLGAQLIGAACLGAEHIGADVLGLTLGGVIRCHRDLLPGGFSHSLHHGGSAFIAHAAERAG